MWQEQAIIGYNIDNENNTRCLKGAYPHNNNDCIIIRKQEESLSSGNNKAMNDNAYLIMLLSYLTLFRLN